MFKSILEMWLDQKKAYIKQSTYAFYHFQIQNYIIPALGNMIVSDVTEDQIQKTVLLWLNTGMENGRPLKKSTVQNLVMLIKQVLKFAVKKNFITACTLEIHFTAQTKHPKPQVFNQKELKRLVCAILNELTYKTFGILLCINSGIRIGELCAMKWSDINLEKQIIHVTKTLQRVYIKNEHPKTRIVITEPKTESSVRDIPLSDKLLSIILKFEDRNINGYILSNTNKYIEPRTFRRFYTNFLVKNNIDLLNFHCLRHTFATRCIENGADYKSLSEILGHTSINMTLNLYVHPPMEEKKKCVDMLSWD